MTAAAPSAVTVRSRAFVEERLGDARAIGDELATLVDRPDELVARARRELARLADRGYAAELLRVVPGAGDVLGVRNPLMAAVGRPVVRALRRAPADRIVALAAALASAPELELRGLALPALRRGLDLDPAAAWDLIRETARLARCWVDVDALAGLVAVGLARDPSRWVELERLTVSDSEWERRLVGSTLATLPHRVTASNRPLLADAPALAFVEGLMGDASPNVQKSLSWALRSWVTVDRPGVERLLAAETDLAVATGDGHRAWVIRDTLAALDDETAGAIRTRLAGIRKRPGAPSTSRHTRPALPLDELQHGLLHARVAAGTERWGTTMAMTERSRPA